MARFSRAVVQLPSWIRSTVPSIAVTHLTHGLHTGGGAVVTASVTVAAGDVLMFSLIKYPTNIEDPSGIVFAGATAGTWIKTGSNTISPFALSQWYCYGAAGSGTITASGTVSTGAIWSVEKVTGSMNTKNGIGVGVAAIGSSGTINLTLASLQNVKSVAFGSFLCHASTGNSVIPGVGFTELAEIPDSGSNYTLQTEYKQNTTTVDASGLVDYNIGVAVEIKAAFDYPSFPTTNDQYGYNNKRWTYNGTAWNLTSPTPTTTHDKTITFQNPLTTAQNVSLFLVPTCCAGTAVSIKAKRTGGTGAVVNVRKNGTTTLIATDLSLTGTSWTDAGSLQNTTFVGGDYFEVQIISTVGGVTELAVQFTFTQTG
jgi:hypothetical protein